MSGRGQLHANLGSRTIVDCAMKRTLDVIVDRSTWPEQPRAPVFPSTFKAGNHPLELNIPHLLLLIGYLTTPSHAFGTSLSEFWAWVRYLHAVSDASDLRLTREFADLDAHQKTILSDDFGMGVPIYWLSEHLSLESLVDGRYFMDRMAETLGARVADPPRHGPRKAPDFVARDTSGVWHVIECKGTQSGDSYRRQQLGSPGPPATGAVAQKHTIAFPTGYTGQRLAGGLVLAADGDYESSNLEVIDPIEDAGLVVKEEDMPLAIDTLKRATASRALRLAGFGAASSAISSARSPWPTRKSQYDIELPSRQVGIETMIERVREQFTRRRKHETLDKDRRPFLVREVSFDLATPDSIQGPGVRSLLLRYGAASEFLDAISQEIEEYGRRASMGRPHYDEVIPQWQEMLGPLSVESDDGYATMRIGSSFFGELRVLDDVE